MSSGAGKCPLVQENDRWYRKAVSGAGLVDAGAELVTAGAGLVNAAAGRSPVQGWLLLAQNW